MLPPMEAIRIHRLGAEDLVERIESNYRRGLPAPLDRPESPFITPALLLASAEPLGPFDDLVVLSFMAIRDPAPATAVAAFARLVARVANQPIAARTILHVHRETRHDSVRRVVDRILKPDFSAETLAAFGRATAETLRRAVADSRRQLSAFLEGLADGAVTPVNPAHDLMRLAQAGNVDEAMLSDVVIGVMRSGKVGPATKQALVRNLHAFPRGLADAVKAHVLGLPPDTENDALKRIIIDPLAAASEEPDDDGQPAPRLVRVTDRRPDAPRRFDWPEEADYPSRRPDFRMSQPASDTADGTEPDSGTGRAVDSWEALRVDDPRPVRSMADILRRVRKPDRF